MDNYTWQNIMAMVLYILLIVEVIYLPWWIHSRQSTWKTLVVWLTIVLTGFALWYCMLTLPRYLGWVH